MDRATGDLNFLWAYAFVDGLAELGVTAACLAPGSRCTPLTLALANHPTIHAYSQFDERSCGFFGLGHAKASGRPVVLVCTSGTAAANFFPAVIEAFHSEVPLIVCTADRPPDLHDRGANQTIDQQRLYGNHVRWFQDTGLPQDSLLEEGYIVSLAERAYGSATGRPVGPVQVNFPFRKPLEPTEPGHIPALMQEWISPPVTPAAAPEPSLPEDDLENVVEMVRQYDRGVILVGPTTYDAGTFRWILSLAETAGYPVLAEGLSQLRFGPSSRDVICHYGAWFLGSSLFLQTHPPDIILRFGRQPTSNVFNTYLETHTNTFQALINETGRLDDATHSLDTVITAPVARFSQAVAARLRRFTPDAIRDRWRELHQQAERLTETILSSPPAGFDGLFEGKVYRNLVPLLPEGTRLMVSNSLPVRDLDLFAPPGEHDIRVHFNRGASGIDGITSTAAGIAAAGESPTVLVTGDLAFLHDLTGLHLAETAGLNLTVILIQNNGGGIFEMLPIARFGQTYEQYVRTPHHVNLSDLVQGFQGQFTEAGTWQEFDQAVNRGLAHAGLQVIQVRTDARQSAKERERLRTTIFQTIGEQLG